MIEASVQYLRSPAAAAAFALDPYWPKWTGPWWHMLLLHEMGETAQIPAASAEQLIAALDRVPDKTTKEALCHCQLGTVYQVLAARGVDVDEELPWLRPRLMRHQMADGGMTCDDDAYLVKDECPSSMVGTIGAFEAILRHTPRAWTADERTFLDRAAGFLVGRQLQFGSSTRFNAAERVSAEAWGKLCFPRFYFYDVLRGLDALVLWAAKTRSPLPRSATDGVFTSLSTAFPDGAVRIGRRAFEAQGTFVPGSPEPKRRVPAGTFPLLDAISTPGQESPYLSRQWRDVRELYAQTAAPLLQS